MNKQELIEKYEKLESVCKDPGAEIARLIFLEDLKELDETQEVEIPIFVADWIKYCKNTFLSSALVRSLIVDEVDFHNYVNQEDFSKLKEFLATGNNQELFARAWLDGYTVEEEKRYLVKVKGVYFNSCLVFDKGNKKWFFSSIYEIDHQTGYHTRKELEEAGFGWVFDCEGIEIEEVE
jgi:phage protein